MAAADDAAPVWMPNTVARARLLAKGRRPWRFCTTDGRSSSIQQNTLVRTVGLSPQYNVYGVRCDD